MNKNEIYISIVIPTYSGSIPILEIPLLSLSKQTFRKEMFEVILADNTSSNSGGIKALGDKYGARTVSIEGIPPQTCNQVNAGVSVAKGKYIFILDHDLELDDNLLKNFFIQSNKEKTVDAWFIPYKIVARGSLLNKIRNFEEMFYRKSIIEAVRIIKKESFNKTSDKYDPSFNAGPGDWDLTNQLRVNGAKFSYINSFVSHHEEEMTFWEFLTKKTLYAKGSEAYKRKWKKKSKKIYKEVVLKQFSLYYRLFGIFVENDKWRMLLPRLHLYVLYVLMKILMSELYIASLWVQSLRNMVTYFFENP